MAPLMWSKLNFIGMVLLPPVTMLIAGLTSRQILVSVKGNTNVPLASWPFWAHLAFIIVHLIGYFIARR